MRSTGIVAWVAFGAIAVVLSGCGNPTADKPAAEVGDAIEILTPVEGEALPEGVVYALTDNSGIDFEGYKVTGPHVGGFGVFEGTVTVPDGDLSQARIVMIFDMKSIYSDNPDLTNRLLGEEFFEVETYPTSTFTSTAIDAYPDGQSFGVTGNLEMHGITKGLTFPATIKLDGTTLTAEAEFTIDRTDWDITYKGMADDLIRDDVLILFEIEAQAQGG